MDDDQGAWDLHQPGPPITTHGRLGAALRRRAGGARGQHARVLGAGNVDVDAGELIAETVHALEMCADAKDIGLTIHPHPTLSEAIGFAAEAAEGTITDSA